MQLLGKLQHTLWMAACQMPYEGRWALWRLPQQLQPPVSSEHCADHTGTGCIASL